MVILGYIVYLNLSQINMAKDKFVIIKKYEFKIIGLNYQVQGKILKQITGNFNSEARFSCLLNG